MRSIKLSGTLSFLLLAAGCSQVNSNQAGAEMSLALSDANDENGRHASACESVASMADMMRELSRHEDMMDRCMARMDGASDRMRTGRMMSEHCVGPTFNHMSSNLTEMHSAMSSHSERMRAASSVDEARAECATHTDAMRELMQEMMGALDSMPCTGM